MSEGLRSEYTPEEERRQRIAELVQATQQNLIAEQSAKDAHDGQETSISKGYQRDADKAFKELYWLTYRDTYAHACGLAKNEVDADDIVQEAYLRAWKGIPRFRGDSEFTTWLYRITANAASDELSKRTSRWKRTISIQENEDSDDFLIPAVTMDVEEIVESKLFGEKVRKSLKYVPPAVLGIVVLKFLYDKSHQQIASELGISETAAKVRLHRARNSITQLITRSGDLIEK